MDHELIKQLHPLELKVLLAFNNDGNNSVFSTQSVVDELGMVIGQANQATSWLLQKSLIKVVAEKIKTLYELTDLGISWRDKGVPVARLFKLVQEQSVSLTEASHILHLEQKDLGTAYGTLSKNGNLRLNEHKKIEVVHDTLPPETMVLSALLEEDDLIDEDSLSDEEKNIIQNYAKKRGAGSLPFKKIERDIVEYTVTELGKECVSLALSMGLTGEELGSLTQEMLKTGSWKAKKFREYQIEMPPNRVSVGRRNPYTEFLEQVKDKLVGLGFEEFDGPLVETEFWNSDALFMPQFHPARDTHDVYYVKDPQYATQIDEPWLSNVANTHENGGETSSRGWNYSFDRDFTRRLLLRSQGTVMSAKTLTHTKIPGKYFGVLRVFRHDRVDATHLSDFYQTEGIIVGDDVQIKTLLGLLRVFAEEFAHAEEVKYVPGYFPFTEPSIEVHIKHPKIGWMELGGAGIFRPEVTNPLGVDVPVAAWGIGIDRMATIQMEINDLRELFSYNLEKIIMRKGVQL